MAVTVEFIIILTGIISYRNIPIAKIHINRGYFILFDADGNELLSVRRMGGTSVAIVSEFIPYLSYGAVLRFLVDESNLYAIDDENGQLDIACEVEVPKE